MVIRPRRFSRALRAASFVSTPRGLNDPVFWRHSALRKSRVPVCRPRAVEDTRGVRCRRPAMVALARRISSRVVVAVSTGGGERWAGQLRAARVTGGGFRSGLPRTGDHVPAVRRSTEDMVGANDVGSKRFGKEGHLA